MPSFSQPEEISPWLSTRNQASKAGALVSGEVDRCLHGRNRLVEWRTALGDDDAAAEPEFDDKSWSIIQVPHNWEDYHGYPEVAHGNLHGTAWYRCAFDWEWDERRLARLYAFFEGVGSYATVYCNGVRVGHHEGGRTTFTVDLTTALLEGENLLAVRAHHPGKIDDLPFVCGGCWGSPNTEGSQPFGIFRPAWLERTGPMRVEPFGVHVVTTEVSQSAARIEIRTELSSPREEPHSVRILTSVTDPDGELWLRREEAYALEAKALHTMVQSLPVLQHPRLWCPEDPALYRVVTEVESEGILSHRTETTFGLRWFDWPRLIEPNADRNVRSPDRRGRMVASGDEPRTPGNNGLTHIIECAKDAVVKLAPMGVVVRSGGPAGVLLVECSFLGTKGAEVMVLCEIQNEGGTIFFHQHRSSVSLDAERAELRWLVPPIHEPRGWSRDDPYLHRLMIEVRALDGTLWERSETLFGFRNHDGPLNLARPLFESVKVEADVGTSAASETKVLRLNGEPLFLNGTCEYEHLLGNDHAFSEEQVAARVAMMRAAGFNAFRDAHHPHNLRYYDHWDRAGMVCWTQMGSRLWFDNPRFRANYKTLVREWVRERRNHPSIIIWGIQNESALPEDFARELTELIRELDPTSPRWRLVTTCNGGKGTDWNVPQEWSGTYGGNCNDYDLEKLQLVGEYGVWRSFGVHREATYGGDENDCSESWACYAIETKIRLAEGVRDRSVGHFHWLFNTFANPGRTATNFEGPGNARVGSVNNKGLVTAWGQPSDLYYLFRANYANPVTEPMVYLVSHTWPDRWREQGVRTVRVFSNCEEVELFNGVRERSLGVRSNPGRGRHFEWAGVQLKTRVLYAVARRDGQEVARDLIELDYLPEDPGISRWQGDSRVPVAPQGRTLYRVSCGAERAMTDTAGNLWEADKPWIAGATWGCESWADRYAPRVERDLASSGYTMTPARGTSWPELYRKYRYGRNALKYHFTVSPGRHVLRLHFVEPWFGVGGGSDCEGWRLFDIAVNERVLERDFDIWSRAGGDHQALIWERIVDVTGTILTVHFPTVRANQALICGIEVLT